MDDFIVEMLNECAPGWEEMTIPDDYGPSFLGPGFDIQIPLEVGRVLHKQISEVMYEFDGVLEMAPVLYALNDLLEKTFKEDTDAKSG